MPDGREHSAKTDTEPTQATVIGLGMGVEAFSILSDIVPPNQTSFCLSLNMATLGIAQFCSTYFASLVMSFSPTGSFMLFCQVALAISVVGTIASLVYGIAKNKKTTAPQ